MTRDSTEELIEGLPVAGYQPQSLDTVAVVNGNKLVEERLLRLLDENSGNAAVDQRWLATARTHFELGFMCLNRAIFRPARVVLPEDKNQ